LGLFAIFDRNLAKIVAPPSDECENYVACLKVQSLPKKRSRESPLRGEKPDFWPVSKNNTSSLPLRGNPAGNQKNKHHIFAPTAGARFTIFPKLCMVIELVVPILKGVIHFWI